MQRQIKTGLGVAVILIFAVTAGVFVWLYEKNQDKGQFNSCKKMMQVCGSGNAGCRWECQDNFIPTNAPKTNVPTFKPSVPANNDSGVDETADWQTYRNDEYGFEFKIPVTWTKPSDTSSLPFINSPCNNMYTDRCAGVYVSVMDYTGGSLEKYLDAHYDSNINPEIKILNKKTVIVDGENSYEVDSFREDVLKFDKTIIDRKSIDKAIIINHNGTVYRITLFESGNDLKDSDYENLIYGEALKQILSTFKFIAPE